MEIIWEFLRTNLGHMHHKTLPGITAIILVSIPRTLPETTTEALVWANKIFPDSTTRGQISTANRQSQPAVWAWDLAKESFLISKTSKIPIQINMPLELRRVCETVDMLLLTLLMRRVLLPSTSPAPHTRLLTRQGLVTWGLIP